MDGSRNDNSGLEAISGSHLFKSLDAEGRTRLLAGASKVSFEAGQVVVREGDPGEALYLIRGGQVRVFTTVEGDTVPLAILGPGACFGEVALLSGRPRTATVVATEPCTMLCFPKRLIEDILTEYPKVRKLLETVVLGRARDTIEKITKPVAPLKTKERA